jgi:hypothetical protein
MTPREQLRDIIAARGDRLRFGYALTVLLSGIIASVVIEDATPHIWVIPEQREPYVAASMDVLHVLRCVGGGA